MISHEKRGDFGDNARVVIENIETRWSCRFFSDELVSRDTVEVLLEAANHAPSPMNTQPWEFIVMTGDVLVSFRQAVYGWLKSPDNKKDKVNDMTAILKGEISHIPFPRNIVAKKKEFIIRISEEVAKIGLSLKDVYNSTFYCYNAPVVIFVVGYRVNRNDRHGLEIHQGLAAAIENILLVANVIGYATCWIGDIMRFGKRLHEHVGLGEEKEIVGGIALGHPDTDMELNKKRINKCSLDGIVDWRGF